MAFSSIGLGQSLADAARASQARHQASATRTVVTDDDIPARPTEASAGSDVDGGMQAEMDHLRAVYLKVCSDPVVQRTHSFSPEMKKELEDAAQPLRKRMQASNSHANAEGAQRLSREEEAEVEAVAGPVGRELTLEERKRIGAIRQKYADNHQALAANDSASSHQSLELLGQLVSMISDCSKAGAK